MGVCVYVCEAGDLFVHVYVYCKYMCLCLFRAYGMYLFEDVFVGNSFVCTLFVSLLVSIQ